MPHEALTLRKIGAYCLFTAAVLALAYRFIKEDDLIERVPDQQSLRTAWACYDCGESLYLTPRQRVESQRTASDFTIGGRQAGDKTAGEEGRTSFRDLILRCPHCGKMELRKAATCPSCKAIYPARMKGTPQKCPRCGWEPVRKKAKRKAGGRRPRKRG